jgi:hypothetical protein
METKFTPGDWNYNYNGVRPVGRDGVLVADVYGGSGGVEMKEANIALICAAPQLYAALEELTEWGRTFTSPQDKNSPHSILIRAVAALTKARGESEA